MLNYSSSFKSASEIGYLSRESTRVLLMMISSIKTVNKELSAISLKNFMKGDPLARLYI